MDTRLVERLPHRAPMRLVDEVIDVTPRSVTCRSTLRDDHILKNSNGDISALLAIELFAQTAAVLMLHRATLKTDGTKMTRGMLVGVRTLDLEVDAFDVGDVLSTRMEERYTADAIVQLAGEVERDGVVVARGAINVARS